MNTKSLLILGWGLLSVPTLMITAQSLDIILLGLFWYLALYLVIPPHVWRRFWLTNYKIWLTFINTAK